jgi:hypothetical protein
MMSQLIPMDAMTDPAQKEQPVEWLGGKSPRQLLQSLGTDWGRDMVSATIWIDAMQRLIAEQSSDVIIIDDCRFDNEAQMVRRTWAALSYCSIARASIIRMSMFRRCRSHIQMC